MKNMNVHLSKDLISKYGIKNFPVRKGDMVRIVRGDAEKDEKLNIVGKEVRSENRETQEQWGGRFTGEIDGLRVGTYRRT